MRFSTLYFSTILKSGSTIRRPGHLPNPLMALHPFHAQPGGKALLSETRDQQPDHGEDCTLLPRREIVEVALKANCPLVGWHYSNRGLRSASRAARNSSSL